MDSLGIERRRCIPATSQQPRHLLDLDLFARKEALADDFLDLGQVDAPDVPIPVANGRRMREKDEAVLAKEFRFGRGTCLKYAGVLDLERRILLPILGGRRFSDIDP